MTDSIQATIEMTSPYWKQLSRGQQCGFAAVLFSFMFLMSIEPAQALAAKFGLTISESTVWTLGHCTMVLYYTHATLPTDLNTRIVTGFFHILFAITHALKILVIVDELYFHDYKTLLQPTIPITNYVNEHYISFELVFWASIGYIIYKFWNLWECVCSEVTHLENDTPAGTSIPSTTTQSTSAPTHSWHPPPQDTPGFVSQEPSNANEKVKAEKVCRCSPASEPTLTREQVDAILADAKEEHDRNTAQEVFKLKKQCKQSEEQARQWRSAHNESLNSIADLKKTAKEVAQKHSEQKSFEQQQARKSKNYFENLACKAKRRAETAERELASIKDELDDRDQTIRSLRVMVRAKRTSADAKPLLQDAQDDSIAANLENLRKQLQEINSENRALKQELEIARSAPAAHLSELTNELAEVKAHSENTESQLEEESRAHNELKVQFEIVKKDLANRKKADGASVSQWKSIKDELDIKSNAYTELESRLKDSESQLDKKTKAYSKLEWEFGDISSQLDGKNKTCTELEMRLKEAMEKAQRAESDATIEKEQTHQSWVTKFQESETLHQQQLDTAQSNLQIELISARQKITDYEAEARDASKKWQVVCDEQTSIINKLKADCSRQEQNMTTAEKTNLESQISRLRIQLEASNNHTECDNSIKRLDDELDRLRAQAIVDSKVLPRLLKVADAMDPHIARFELAIKQHLPVEWIEKLFDCITDEYFLEWYNDHMGNVAAAAVPGDHTKASRRGRDDFDGDAEEPQVADPSKRVKKRMVRRIPRTEEA
ncbi:hypothetical protein FKW77_002405 [Venturia effusa]|uniref:Uncharacterized protein n=1 Tax=Venturia effusa TaxID=50376 RepID=A0A517L8T1_9PEZI|nr:hypothetical protein FKW77_002405 [Venturia effusa]